MLRQEDSSAPKPTALGADDLPSRDVKPGFFKPGWGLRLVGLLILLLPGGLGFYGLVLWLSGGGETHALNVGQLVFIAIGLPSYMFGGLMYYAGWRAKRYPPSE